MTTPEGGGQTRAEGRREVALSAIFLVFTKVTMASIGGSLTAWARRVLVDERGWVTNEEFLEGLSLCQVLPGPNNVNLSIYIGRRLRGPAGAAVAVLGLTVLPLVIISILTVLYFKYGSTPHVDRAMDGLNAATAGLIAATAFQLGTKHFRKPVALGIALATLALVGILRLPMLPVLVVAGLVSIALCRRAAAKKSREDAEKETPG